MQTEFKDKYGKQLYVGDIVRYFLSGMGSGGPHVLQITRNKKGVVKLSVPGDPDKSGWVVRHTYEPFMTLIDTQYREAADARRNSGRD